MGVMENCFVNALTIISSNAIIEVEITVLFWILVFRLSIWEKRKKVKERERKDLRKEGRRPIFSQTELPAMAQRRLNTLKPRFMASCVCTPVIPMAVRTVPR